MRTVVSSVALVVGSLGVDGADDDSLGVALMSSVGSSSLPSRFISSRMITTAATIAITAISGHTQLRRSSSSYAGVDVVGGGAGAITWVAGAGGGATTAVAAVAGLRSAAASSEPSA